jgi:hypothetical protein
MAPIRNYEIVEALSMPMNLIFGALPIEPEDARA